jgi:DNA primase large subunit
MTSSEMERLFELLCDELEIYGQIRKLTEYQAEFLEKIEDNDEYDAFNSSLDKREGLIGKIKGLHQEKETLMQSYVSFTKNETNNTVNTNIKSNISEIENIKKQIQDILKICSDLNDKNIILMKEKTKEQTHKIDEHSAKRKGIGGYAQAVVNTPEMFDKKT